jgi:hypothetical protein
MDQREHGVSNFGLALVLFGLGLESQHGELPVRAENLEPPSQTFDIQQLTPIFRSCNSSVPPNSVPGVRNPSTLWKE